MATRVQIPAYTDRWMMGDRYGEIVRVVRKPAAKASWLIASMHTTDAQIEIAHVKLDKSGKVVRVVLDDCTEV